MSNWHIRQAARVVQNGGVIGYPTEAVYGLGCSPWDLQAVAKILQLKKRKPDNGLIIVAADESQLLPFIDYPDSITRDKVLATWPGPVTWIIPASTLTPVWITGIYTGVAVRVSAHPIVRQLCQLSGPLVSTSANPTGMAPAKTLHRTRCYFPGRLDYIVPGKLGDAEKPTEIRDALTDKLIRS